MQFHMTTPPFVSIGEIKNFLKSNAAIEYRLGDGSKTQVYTWIAKVLIQFQYRTLGKQDRIVIQSYLLKLTGYSKSHLKRLIHLYYRGALCPRVTRNRHRFPKRYGPADIALLIKTDNAHGRLSGRATSVILRREYEKFGKQVYRIIANISHSHIYNLRRTRQYRSQAMLPTRSTPAGTAIGARRKPDPCGKPGFIRVDTVHQGDWDGQKGIYYVNLVDEVTQWEVVVCLRAITRGCMIPALRVALDCFPFKLHGFHADNGSEYLNHTVAELLNALMIEFTKSRPRHSNDNALAETKNGDVNRKHFGYRHIPRTKTNVELINVFLKTHFNPYLNWHRPSAYPTIAIDEKGREQRCYKTWEIPYERFKALKSSEEYLKPGAAFAEIEKMAYVQSDNEAAEAMQKAKLKLLKNLNFKAAILNEITSDAL
jgi:hypothetical protein